MVAILDTTLREGEQTPGVYFDPHIKLAIARMLDDVGVSYIEAGHPQVDEEIRDAVAHLARSNLSAKVCAHARSLQSDVDLALQCGAQFIGIFYCITNERLSGVFKSDLNVAIAQITKVIRYAKAQNPSVIIRYTPEDTVRTEFENVRRAAVAAVEAGADIISIADTTGHMIPGTRRSMHNYVTKLRDAFRQAGVNPKIAVHCHNDRGLALANALDAFRAGADIIDASVLGLGERAGIVDLAQLLVALQQDFESGEWNLSRLPDLYNFISQHTGVPIPANFPILGEHAFTHCAGVHTHAAMINPVHYQSVDPSLVGREMQISLDHMSGLSSVQYALREIEAPQDLADELLPIIKSIGKKGRTVSLNELRHIVHAQLSRRQSGQHVLL